MGELVSIEGPGGGTFLAEHTNDLEQTMRLDYVQLIYENSYDRIQRILAKEVLRLNGITTEDRKEHA